jgi:hypothetical protein
VGGRMGVMDARMCPLHARAHDMHACEARTFAFGTQPNVPLSFFSFSLCSCGHLIVLFQSTND